jgi:acetate kinase
MDNHALVLNAGSSSLKFCVYRRPEAKTWQVGARGQIEGIGSSARLSIKDDEGRVLADQKLDGISDGRAAISALAVWLRGRYAGARLLGVGHRVVHGGARFSSPIQVTPQILDELYGLVPLAPLHQPYNLAAIAAVFEHMPEVPQVACFDTGFHRNHAAVAKVIPLPRDLCKAELQRYGFHGLSYEYIASVLPAEAPEIAMGRVIVAHLGNGASLCAIKEGKSVDSTMAFTALDGLCMGTRPGAIDPGALLYLVQNLKLSGKDLETVLYKQSGLLGISGISHDMRVLLTRTEPEARLAIDYFVYRIAKEIGALAAVLGGIDGLIFTAGIGENSTEIRQRVCEASRWLGIELDAEANRGKGPRISTPRSKVSAWMIATNEELMIARHTATVIGLD